MCALLCLASDPFTCPSASMPLALSLKIAAEIAMIKLEADFDLCFMVTHVCRESTLSMPMCLSASELCSVLWQDGAKSMLCGDISDKVL